ncbi:MAG: hypothetical protein ACRD6W_02600 [Nitrososphaerales archaeon]
MRPFHLLPLLILTVLMLCAIGVGADAAGATATGGPVWAIKSVALPTNFSTADNESCETGPQQCDTYLVTAINIGTKPSIGTITLTDHLPPGILLQKLHFPTEHEPGFEGEGEGLRCGAVVQGASSVSCEYEERVPPGGVLEIPIEVTVSGSSAASVANQAEVEGGEATAVTTSEPSTVANTVNGTTPSFGLQDFSVGVFGPSGESDAQAGDHPAAVTTTIDYTTTSDLSAESGFRFLPVQEPKTEIVDLPLGFVGDPQAAAQCPESTLYNSNSGRSESGYAIPCPADSQVGVLGLEFHGFMYPVKLYNMVPEPGYPAMFGFERLGTTVYLRARVLPTSSGYVLSVSVPDIARAVGVKISGVTLTFFGDPAEEDGNSTAPLAFFTNPTDCSEAPMKARIEMDSWVDPEHWVSAETPMYAASATQGVSGCDLLAFNPTIELAPEETRADTPTGYEIDLKVPQAPNIYPDLATPDLRNAEVTLPEGVSVSPSAADGLVGCEETGPEGIQLGNNDAVDSENKAQEGEELGPDGLVHAAAGHCPKASQIGTVEVTTPLLHEKLEGDVYVAQPKCGGEGQSACTPESATNGELFGLYLEVAGSGVIVKLKGTVSVNATTGRITTRFDENPQLPFSELKLKLNGGPRAPLASPRSCGAATTTSVLEPWSAPESGAAATPFSTYAVAGCAGPTRFNPTFSAGTLTPAAGSFSSFTTTFSRQDGEQDLSAITVRTPPGLLGKISEVPLCQEPQAAQGTCSSASQIGTATAAVGAGSHPFWQSGPVYLTGPYKGAPFGLSVVVPAKAGPYNLGNVVVRAAISVNPYTAAVTITSDPLPQIIDGVPLRTQVVNVTVNRPGFMFNPTNCDAQQVTATITAAQGAGASVASPFAAAGCKNLPFTPKFTASTLGKASKADGASLKVDISSAGLGQASIAKVDLTIPKSLPSRLTTLQKACTEAQFDANPAGCPAASDIATATVHTPILSSPLTGPAYFVSRGGAAFPDVEIVLQGEGVKLTLDGHTQIKNGVTYSRFESVPDAPFTSFEFNAPEGPYSIFAAYASAEHPYDLCAVRLTIPTTITAQNGAVINQKTPVAVTGCHAVTIATRRLHRRSVIVTVKLTAKGVVTVTGRGLKRYRKTLDAGLHQIKVGLSKVGLAARARHRKITIKVALRSVGKTSGASTTLKL